jgi:hypothetical protein
MWFQKGKRKPPPLPDVVLGGKVLEYVQQYKYLGLVLDNQLSFKFSVEQKVRECHRRASFIWRLGSAPKRKRRVLWNAFVGSYLFYGLCTFFRFLTKTRTDALHRVYFSAARQISGLIKSAYGPTALQESGLEPLPIIIDNRRRALLERMNGGRLARRVHRDRWDCVEVTGNENARSIELPFSRWRADAMYSNRLKFRMGSRENDLCRICNASSETREHILFYCEQISESDRNEYSESVRKILGHRDDMRLTINDVLALGKKLKRSQVKKLAISLWRFLTKIEYIA